jgi:hypothetical protein
LAAMKAISAAEKNIVRARQAAAIQTRLTPPPHAGAGADRRGPPPRASAPPSPP